MPNDRQQLPPFIIAQNEGGVRPIGGLYVHLPYCETKCGYCDFYSVPVEGQSVVPTIDAIGIELRNRFLETEIDVATVFIGGGTPTILDNDDLDRLLAATTRHLRHPPDEFTIEANPATVDDAKAATLIRHGVNRVSLGAQSFHADELKFLERLHSPEDVAPGVGAVRQAGICNINLDLIFGIGGQTIQSWRESLQRAVDLEPKHMACYGLTYEKGTVLTGKLRQGLIEACDENLEADMYLLAIDFLRDAGFEHYEISNFAKPGFACQHNLNYWNNRPYVGVGPSAAGYDSGMRYKNIASATEYVRLIARKGHAVIDQERLDGAALALEALMLQMRLVPGIDLDSFRNQTGVNLEEACAATVKRLLAGDMVMKQQGRLYLTRKGLLFADAVITELSVALDSGPGKSLPVVQSHGSCGSGR